jgi:hypothetical protein
MVGHQILINPLHRQARLPRRFDLGAPRITQTDRTPAGEPVCGADDAGERSAVLFTIIENCRRLGLNPYDYLKDALTRLPAMTNQQTHTVTSAAWAREKAKTEPPAKKLAS